MREDQKISTTELRHAVHEIAVPRIRPVRLRKYDPVQFVKMGIYLSTLEQSEVVSAIIESGLGYHSYPILRCQMEGLADLINLNRDERYISNLELQYGESFHKQFVAGKRGNPYFKSLSSAPEFSEELSTLGSKAKSLRARGARRLEPKEKIDLAGMSLEYEALYGLLNDHCHGGIRALTSRHLRIENDEHKTVIFDHGSKGEFYAPIQTSLDIVLRSSVEIHEAFGTGEDVFFRSMINEMSLEEA